MELTEKVLLHQQGLWSWDNIWDDLQVIIEKKLAHEFHDNNLVCIFLDKIHNRCQKMAGSFEYRGKLFEAFLSVHLKFALRSYKKELKTQSLKDISYQNFCSRPGDASGAMFCADMPQSHYSCQHDSELDFSSIDTESRRIILTALKNPFCLDDKLIQKIAKQCSVPASWIFCRCEELKERLQKKYLEKQKIEEKLAAIQIQLEVQGIEAKREISLNKMRARLLERWQKTKLFPHHKDMAICLQIPKGTIDSSFYYLRKLAQRADQKTQNGVGLVHETKTRQRAN